jgi:hypothetical protein
MKKMTAMLAGAVLLLTACNKEKRNDVTKENLVGTYTLIASESQVGAEPVEDDLLTMEPCEKDDQLKLNGDGTYNGVDAGTQCNPNGNENGSWSLPSASKLQIGVETLDIKSFDGRTLVVESRLDLGNQTYRQKVTLRKK